MESKIDIRSLSLDALVNAFEELGEKKFRAKQVYEWLWKKSAFTFSQMTNLSKPLREILESKYQILPVSISSQQISNDGTIKYGLRLHDNHLIESVLIPTNTRLTACISSQVGCSLTCKFCATGYMKRLRNLTHAEIYDQVYLMMQQAEEHFGRPLTNVVFMGMGEPLLNYAHVVNGIDKITSEEGLHFSAKRITVSTAGISKMIRKLADEKPKMRLALSLHAANDVKRNEIMPINETNNLPELKSALIEYYNKTKERITLEYIVFNNINDGLEDAKELYDFAKSFPCKINIIEYNPIDQATYQNSTEDKIDQFSKFLERKGIVVNVRRSRGKDIDAACGQLAGKSK